MRLTTTRAAIFLVLLVTLWTASGRSAASAVTHLTGSNILSRLYEQILNADFESADLQLKQARSKLPAPACDVLEATALWWRIQLDPASPALDGPFTAAIDKAIASAEAWTVREPARAEAWFYVGGAYAVRVQWRVLRDEKLAAARDGKRIKEALERAVALEPSFDDAYFGIGLYRYYADIAPAAAKVLRWILFLPGGDRAGGLEQMLRTQERGEILRSEADYQLYIIYLWYEKQPQTALSLLDRLKKRHPGNPLFWTETARVEDVYLHDVMGSLDSSRRLLQAAQQRRINAPDLAAAEARLGMARQYEALSETDRTIDVLNALIESRPAAPYGALPTAYLELGEAHDRLGQRALAEKAYRAVIAATGPRDTFALLAEANRALRQRPDARLAQAYRLSLDGWRAFERHTFDKADTALKRSLEINAADPLTHYRYARLLSARGEYEPALAELDKALLARGRPSPLTANAYLESAIILERTGAPERAAQMYESAKAAFGASSDVRAAASRALARLQSATVERPSPIPH